MDYTFNAVDVDTITTPSPTARYVYAGRVYESLAAVYALIYGIDQ